MADATFALEGGSANSPIQSFLNGTVTSVLSGSAGTALSGDVGTKVSGEITIKPESLTMKLTGDATQPVASTVEVMNLPRLTLNDIKDVLTPKMRIHVPNYQQMSFKLLGLELFTWCLSGETQVITQPLILNQFEQCKIECPDEDRRPFPASTPTHKLSVDSTVKRIEREER